VNLKLPDVRYDTEANKPLESDIVASLANLKDAEKKHGTWNLPKESNVQLASDPICNSVGCTQWMWGEKLKTNQPDPVLYDYEPSLDSEVINTWDSLNIAEQIKNHEWYFDPDVYKKKDDDDRIEYNLDPKLDSDVIDTQAHLKDTEETLGHQWQIFKD